MVGAIAGSRKLQMSVVEIDKIVLESGFDISSIVSGKEPNGIDHCGELWAKAKGIPLEKEFPPEWGNFNLPKNIVKINRYGKRYNSYAGIYRNHQMVDYLKDHDGALIVIYDGKSRGSADALSYAKKVGLPIYVKIVLDKI